MNYSTCGCGNTYCDGRCGCHNSCEAVICVPCEGGGTPGHPDVKPPSITIEELLKLIDAKCDKTTCKVLQFEIDMLYWMLGQSRPSQPLPPGTVPPDPLPPGTVPPNGGGVIPKCPDGTYTCHRPCDDGTWDCYPDHPPHSNFDMFQIVANMVEKLDGDLTDKYPSAELLKKELMALWKCMSSKQTHHGDWKDNWTYRTVNQTDDHCLLDGGKDPAPDKIKVITPVDVGSTVFHTITNDKGEKQRCLFESLVDNNVTEPSMLSVLEGKWINYCDIKKVIDCVLPRVAITDCHEKCDDPNHDGVHEGRQLCECVICEVVDTNTVDLTKTKLPVSKDNPLGQGNSIKADVKISKAAGNGITAKPDGLYGDHVVDYQLVPDPDPNKPNHYVITMGNGHKFSVPVPKPIPAPPQGNLQILGDVDHLIYSTGELKVGSVLPHHGAVPISTINGLPRDYKVIILRIYFELDDEAGQNSEPTGCVLRVNGQHIGTVEGGGPSGPMGDNFWNGDFYVKADGSDNINFDITLGYGGTSGAPVVETRIRAIGYFA